MADTLFKESRYTVKQLVEQISLGTLALPDLQRPFVWEKSKVRDLLDSMYKGFPVGYLLLWNTGATLGTHSIGVDDKQAEATTFIVDGQQRLTSLYAVMKGEKVKNKRFEEEEIRIAFRPRDGAFAVSDAANRKDPEFLPNISDVWVTSEFEAAEEFIGRLAESRRTSEGQTQEDLVSREEGVELRKAISRLHNLETFSFVANEIGSSADDEQVAEIFMRINSGGTKLNQADFILTLMSVYREEDRRRLESFSEEARSPSPDGSPSPYNHLIAPSPDQLLRTAVLNAFERGRLSSVTQLLRGAGVDEGEELSADQRATQFAELGAAIDKTLDLNDWHEFLKVLQTAGFYRQNEISSANNIMFAYAFYLLGRHRYSLSHGELRTPMARFFFMSSLTGRYSGSFETQVTQDARILGEATDAEEFLAKIDQLIGGSLTEDFWVINLPEELNSSAARGPGLFGYGAALCLLDARLPITSSGDPMSIKAAFDPAINAPKAAIERHHLFPRAYLKKQGITATTKLNQIANMAFVEWPDNIEISDSAPSEYWPKYSGKFTEQDLIDHGLFEGWADLEYDEFLGRRRQLMAATIRRGFETIGSAAAEGQPAASAGLSGGSPESS